MQTAKDTLEAGTGFMPSVRDILKRLQDKGYTTNLIPRFDHFESDCGTHHFGPNEFVVDEVLRFENTSDPDDQAILYAISSPRQGIKGVYIDSYGFYHDELSSAMLQHLRKHRT